MRPLLPKLKNKSLFWTTAGGKSFYTGNTTVELRSNRGGIPGIGGTRDSGFKRLDELSTLGESGEHSSNIVVSAGSRETGRGLGRSSEERRREEDLEGGRLPAVEEGAITVTASWDVESSKA